ncbi:MAG: aspartate carbamoyltransferase [Clostridia bacterium]|nr:aspartate carbamoyltransferase [Clostridia bacterium]
MRNLLDITDFSVEELNELLALAEDIIASPERYAEKCKGKKIATLFFEPSTRTRLSFEAAMIELGGQVLGFESASTSSAAKGESIADTIRVVGNYADIIAMRHPSEGAPYVSAEYTDVPIINAGDGGHSHPTQTLADLLTIHREIGHLNGLTVGLCGDLKFGRTVHSLISAMSRYEGVKFVLISPKELALPAYMIEKMQEQGIEYSVTEDMEECMAELDVLYMTRVQKERFEDASGFGFAEDKFILTAEKLKKAKPEMRVLHPLPRVNEITFDVDKDERAAYFRQTFNGKIMRMALILKLLEERALPDTVRKNERISGRVCTNKKCITRMERDLESYSYKTPSGEYACIYCDAPTEKK